MFRHISSPLRLLAALAIVIGVSAVPIAQVAACSCMAMSPDEAATMAEVLYTFTVDGVAKGDVGTQVGVVGGGDSAGCGMTFTMNERWLVFANTQVGALATSLCAGNVTLQPDEKPPIAVRAPTASDPEDAAGSGVPVGVILPIAAVVALAGVSALVFWRADRARGQ